MTRMQAAMIEVVEGAGEDDRPVGEMAEMPETLDGGSHEGVPPVDETADAAAHETGEGAGAAGESTTSRRRRREPVEVPAPTAAQVETIEALLFAAERPLADARIGEVLALPEEVPAGAFIAAAVESINASLESTGRVVRVRRVAGGWRVMVEARFAPVVDAMKGQRSSSRLSPAALETLSIIAYRQPITRAHIEAIRGVACGEVLRGLLERRLVRIAGRAEELGRPMLYGTTREFLLAFGLATLADLPNAKEFAEPKPRGRAVGKASPSKASANETSANEASTHEADPASRGPSEPG
jgi:segregation and condensation protein B